MVKHTQTIRLQQRTNCLSVFGHFVGLAVKGLRAIFHDLENLVQSRQLARFGKLFLHTLVWRKVFPTSTGNWFNEDVLNKDEDTTQVALLLGALKMQHHIFL